MRPRCREGGGLSPKIDVRAPVSGLLLAQQPVHDVREPEQRHDGEENKVRPHERATRRGAASWQGCARLGATRGRCARSASPSDSQAKMDPAFLALSRLRRRRFDEALQISSELLEAQPLDQVGSALGAYRGVSVLRALHSLGRSLLAVFRVRASRRRG